MQKVRRLPLHHAANVRDLGGYAAKESSMTAWHRLYRGDSLQHLDEHDWQMLKDLNVKWIIDLRSAQEIETMGYACEAYGIHSVPLPFMKEEIQQDGNEAFFESMQLSYETMVDEVPENIVAAMDVIANALQRKEAVLFHCTAGKDRTGILSALILALCGVEEADILADYQVSASYIAPRMKQLIPEAVYQSAKVQALLASDPAMMQPLLDKLKQEGCEHYLLRIGCKKESLDCIRQAFLKY